MLTRRRFVGGVTAGLSFAGLGMDEPVKPGAFLQMNDAFRSGIA